MRIKDLEKHRDLLVEEIKKLEEKYKKGKIDKDAYNEKRHKIERALIETMDRLTQMHFLSGQE